MALGYAEWIAATGGAVAVFLLMVVVFCCLRSKYPRFYEPRRLLLVLDPGLQTPRPAGGCCSWWCRSTTVSNEELVNSAGLDAFAFVFFLKTALKLFLILTLVAGVILIPIYIYGANNLDDLHQFTLANVGNKQSFLWAPWVLTYAVTAITFYVLFTAYRTIAGIIKKHRYVHGPERHTILVTCIPEEAQSEKAVKDFFERLYPGEVHKVAMVMQTGTLRGLVEELREAKKALANSEAELAETGKRPTHRVLKGKVDSIDHYSAELEKLQGKVKAERAKPLLPTESAFVSFTTALTAAKAARGYSAEKGWRTTEAPEPRDLHWDNLELSQVNRRTRRSTGFALYVLLHLFWTIPISFCAALTTLDNLKSVGFIETIVESSQALETFLQGFLPTVVLVLFMAFLPDILLFMVMREGTVSLRVGHRRQIERLFAFEVIHGLFVVALGSTFLQSVEDMVESPGDIPKLLGDAFPKFATFFGGYVPARACFSYGWELVRGVRFGLHWLGMKSAYSAEAKNELEDPQYGYGLGEWSSAPLFVFVVSMTYSVHAPLILPLAVFFYMLAVTVFQHQFMWAYRPMYQSNGKLWPTLFSRACAGIVIFQVIMIAVLGVKYAPIQSALTIPLPFITLGFRWFCHDRYEQRTQEIPLDILEQTKTLDDLSVLDTAYVHPALRPEADFAPLPTDAVFQTFQVMESNEPAAPSA
eukprot:TRINITY_DN3653_c0_g1_i1.p1 TRINITY_DN3653_c0_g1~~TRINITY_DN3653_c0_g1_i1.p1  ORF type:complete len:730 (+),score=272.75 TRINITY_DN3653_c0_g1_i1:88-2190(+)